MAEQENKGWDKAAQDPGPSNPDKSHYLDAVKYSYKEQEQYLYDKLRKLEKFESIYGKKMSNGTKVDRLKKQRQEMQDTLGKIDKALEAAEGLKFQEGDIAYHKDHGALIVKEVVVDLNDYTMMPIAPEPYKFYYKVASKSGDHVLPVDEVLEHTTAAKVLYDKKK